MKQIRMAIVAGLVFLSQTLNAQTVASFAPVTAIAPDSIVQITAEAYGLSQVPPEQVPPFGTFWLASPGGFNGLVAAPLPCPPTDPTFPIYQIADGIFLVDGTGGQIMTPALQSRVGLNSAIVNSMVSAQSSAVADLIDKIQQSEVANQLRTSIGMSTMMSADSLSLTDSGSGGALYADFQIAPVDYGTNLWIAQTAVVAGHLNGIGSNTIANVFYTIQSRTNLLQPDWQFEDTILGSDLTNWTPLSVAQNNRTNLFLRLRSEQSSDGSGLPDWWQKLYFGTNGVDPNGNPAGDGWSNIQKYQAGWNPNQFYTPDAPQGVTANYNANNATATVSWLPAAGAVTNYTVMDNHGYSVNISANATSAAFNLANLQPYNLASGGPNVSQAYCVQAQYADGTSAASDWAGLGYYGSNLPIYLVPGGNGSVCLAVATSILPADTAFVRLTRVDQWVADNHLSAAVLTNFDIPLSAFINGMYSIPAGWQVPPADVYNHAKYSWWGETLNAGSGMNSKATLLSSGFNVTTNIGWMVPPCFDGRVQLKQNLTFQLRAAVADSPFVMQEFYTHYPFTVTTAFPFDYAYAGFYQFDDYHNGAYNQLLPFVDNYKYRNFVFDLMDLKTDGSLLALTNYADGVSWATHGLGAPQRYQFQPPATSQTNIAALLDINTARWLDVGLNFYAYYDGANQGPNENYSEIALVPDAYNGVNLPKTMAAGISNLFGLPFVSTKVAWGNINSKTLTLNPGDTETNDFYLYSEVGQPKFRTDEYDFLDPRTAVLPGDMNFQPTDSTRFLLTSVANSLKVVGYAKLEVTNSCYTGVYGYLGQYFDKAYKVDGNGNVTITNTGILSPYGDFFATEPGPAALVTMPDIDTGERGTCMVYSVSCVIDRTQGSNMDLSFNGANATSEAAPAVIWANNNYDRSQWSEDDGSNIDDDLSPADIAKLSAYQKVPDCNYANVLGHPCIPSNRDLEDYFRLWTPGLKAAMNAAPTNYAAQLTLTGDGAIRIFRAVELDGGTNYLYDEGTASAQVANSAYLYVGLLSSAQPVLLDTAQGEHYIFCGAQIGSAQIDLQILDGNGNVVADSATHLQIKDIKQMYERWSVGESPSITPAAVAINADGDFNMNSLMPAFTYPTSTDTNMPYILLVHGWNMPTTEKDRFAETAYKRLYWQGYKGQFGLFRWPTDHGFGGFFSGAPNQPWNDPKNFDRSEFNAWESGIGLKNMLTRLNILYPGHVYLMAHSMGNVVAGEALKLAGANQPVNTYVALQGAISAHCYDATTPNRISFARQPDRYASYWASGSSCYFTGIAGAQAFVNFYNVNDFALNKWNIDQNYKPDVGYGYNETTDMFERGSVLTTTLFFPQDTHEIFAYADPAWSYALGAQAGTKGAFSGSQVNLQTIWPADQIGQQDYSSHFWHSAEFRGDCSQQASFWRTVMGVTGFNLK